MNNEDQFYIFHYGFSGSGKPKEASSEENSQNENTRFGRNKELAYDLVL